MFYQRIMQLALVSVLGTVSMPANAQTVSTENTLRAELAQNPENDFARERLAVILLRSGRPEAALFHARYLSGRAESQVLRDQAGDLVSRLEGPTWGWQPIFSVVPSSNLNKGANGDTIYIGDRPFKIDEDSRAKDGIGLTFGASIWKNWRPNEVWRGTASGEATATIYPDSDIKERQSIAAALSFDRKIGRHSLAFGLSVDAQAKSGRLERRRITPFLSGVYDLTPYRQLKARLDWSDIHYPQERFRGGPTTRLVLGLQETLSPRTRLHFSLPFATERTDRGHLDNDSVGASIRVERLWGDGAIKTTFGVAYGQDSYRSVFPGTSIKRKDMLTTLSLEVSNSKVDIKGFVPTLRYEYTRSHSNVSLYDYDSHDVMVAFRKKF